MNTILLLFLFVLLSCNNKPKVVEKPIINKDTIPDSTLYYKALYKPFAENIDKWFSKQHKRTQFYGNVLFAEKGRVIFKKSYGYKKYKKSPEVTLDNSFQIASVTKTFTATAIMMLHEKGVINVNDLVRMYIPEFPYKDWDITIKQLLSHRSGLSKYTHFVDNPDTIWPEKDCSINNEDVIKIMEQIEPPLAKTPDKRFYYTNTNFMLLASIIERATGMSYHDFIEQKIFQPLEMKSSKVYYRDNEGLLINPVKGYESNFREALDIYLNGCEGDKGIYSTVEDMLKFDQSFYNETLISKESQEMMFKGYSKSNRWKNYANYGFGFRMIELPKTREKIVYHNGWWRGFRSYFIRRIEKEQTIIILTNVKRGSFLQVKDLIRFLPQE